jgi:hypothetical protein
MIRANILLQYITIGIVIVACMYIAIFSHRKDPGSRPEQSMWDLCWTKWHWDRFFSELFGIPVNIIPPLLHIHSCIIWGLDYGPVSGRSSVETGLVSPLRSNIDVLAINTAESGTRTG